jgi:nicotinamide riboside kinase
MSAALDNDPFSRRGRVLALVGAESTGKTTLSQALAERVRDLWGVLCEVVPEALRHWCTAQGRTPERHEQAAIAQAQAQAILQAQERSPSAWVLADTTPLMTAVYSQWVFGDESLLEAAREWHQAHCWGTLLLATDIPWCAEPGIRDGSHAQAPVQALLQTQLQRLHGRVATVSGAGSARVDAAWQVLQGWWSDPELVHAT